MIIEVISRWIELISLVFLTGIVLTHLWVLTPAGSYPDQTALDEQFRFSIWRPFGPLMAIMAVAATAEFLARILNTSGSSLISSSGLLPTVISRTHFGRVWLIKISLLFLLAVIFLVSGRKRIQKRPALFLMLIVLMLAAIIGSVYGHPSDKGSLKFRDLNLWFHLMGAQIWGGGLLALSTLVLPRIIKGPDDSKPETSPIQLAGIARRFSAMAGLGVGVMAITAVFNYLNFVGSEKALLDTPYGLTVLVKMVFFLALLNLGAFNRYASVPVLERWAGSPSGKGGFIGRIAGFFYTPITEGRTGYRMALLFKRLIRFEMLLVIILLFCAALLSQEIPARQALHMKQMGGTSSLFL